MPRFRKGNFDVELIIPEIFNTIPENISGEKFLQEYLRNHPSLDKSIRDHPQFSGALKSACKQVVSTVGPNLDNIRRILQKEEVRIREEKDVSKCIVSAEVLAALENESYLAVKKLDELDVKHTRKAYVQLLDDVVKDLSEVVVPVEPQSICVGPNNERNRRAKERKRRRRNNTRAARFDQQRLGLEPVVDDNSTAE